MTNHKQRHNHNTMSSVSVVYEVSEYQTHHPAVVVFLCIVYAVLSLVAFAGNALVIWIIRE